MFLALYLLSLGVRERYWSSANVVQKSRVCVIPVRAIYTLCFTLLYWHYIFTGTGRKII